MKNDDRFQTRAIHIGNSPDKESGAVAPPIHLTSTFEQEEVGKDKGFDYTRASNPTRALLEKHLQQIIFKPLHLASQRYLKTKPQHQH